MIDLNMLNVAMTGGSLLEQAHDLFKRAVQAGARRRLLNTLLRRSNDLQAPSQSACLNAPHYVGIQEIPLSQIIGSEGRSADFTAEFAPKHRRMRDRWVQVALARMQGRSLPPIHVMRTCEGYFVRDGNHRVSVARALGEYEIAAEVITYV